MTVFIFLVIIGLVSNFLDAIFGGKLIKMKKWILLLSIPMMVGCVSNKKYAELEAQTKSGANYEQVLLELLSLREAELSSGAEHAHEETDREMLRLKTENAALKRLEDYSREGQISDEVAMMITEELRMQAEQQFHMESEKPPYPCNEALIANVDIEASAFVFKQKTETIANLEVAQNQYDLQVRYSRSKFASTTGALTANGKDILSAALEAQGFKDALKLKVILPLKSSVSSADGKLAENILKQAEEYSKSHKVNASVVFEFRESDDITLDIRF